MKSEQYLNNNRQTHVGEQMRVFHLGQRVLSSQKPLSGRAVSLSLAVLLECIGYRDRPETNQVKRTAYLIIIAYTCCTGTVHSLLQ